MESQKSLEPPVRLQTRKLETLKKGERVKIKTGAWVRLMEDVRFYPDVAVKTYTIGGHLIKNKVRIPVSYIQYVEMYDDSEHPVLVI
ncbi:MAG TPA: hypothetical protein VIY48_08975 [Candidatus Paceibacterota bacterium]